MINSQHLPRSYQWMLRVTPETPVDVVAIIDPNNLPVKEPRRFKCAHCQNPVAFEVDVIQIGDIPSDTAQVNPHGFIHEVITVQNVQNTLVEDLQSQQILGFQAFAGDT